jgi:hypothetical protein
MKIGRYPRGATWCPMWMRWTRNEKGEVVSAENRFLRFVLGQAWKWEVLPRNYYDAKGE